MPSDRTRKHLSVRQCARTISTPLPIEVERQEQEATKTTRPEVRFVLPRRQPTSSTVDTVEQAQASSAKPDVPTAETDDDLYKARLRLDLVQKRKEKAEKANDLATASDLIHYAISDLKVQIER